VYLFNKISTTIAVNLYSISIILHLDDTNLYVHLLNLYDLDVSLYIKGANLYPFRVNLNFDHTSL